MQRTTERTVTFSPLAIERVKYFMAKEKALDADGLRIFVMPGGCSGYQYGMVLEKEQRDGDITWSESGINVYIDPQSARLLQGSNIDFVETVQGSGFKINNPNAVSSCGCGKSFETEESAAAHSHSHGEDDEECACGGHHH